MSESEATLRALRRWAHVQRPRKDVPRVFKHLDDDTLTDLLRRANHTLTILLRIDQKCFDAQPEARRIRAMGVEERNKLRRETLAAATGMREELRRRMVSAPPTSGSQPGSNEKE